MKRKPAFLLTFVLGVSGLAMADCYHEITLRYCDVSGIPETTCKSCVDLEEGNCGDAPVGRKRVDLFQALQCKTVLSGGTHEDCDQKDSSHWYECYDYRQCTRITNDECAHDPDLVKCETENEPEIPTKYLIRGAYSDTPCPPPAP